MPRGLVLAGLATVAAVAAAAAVGPREGDRPAPVTYAEIEIRYSRFSPTEIRVPAGVPVTFTFRNDDPIDHEWIVGDEELHEYHRTGTELIHGDRPTEVLLPALATQATTVTFDAPGRLRFICHLPQHESYGMVGVVIVER